MLINYFSILIQLQFHSISRLSVMVLLGFKTRISLLDSREYSSMRYVPFSILFIIIILPYIAADWNPYDVLGVKRDANIDQIKKAYRDLARKFHPDKSTLNEDESGRRFIELNKAFNILKDPSRRSRFDRHGETDDNRHTRGYHQANNRQNHNRQTREYWDHDGFRTFTFFQSDGRFRKKSISSKQYYEYLKESRRKPVFVFFYSEFCPSCSMLEPEWSKITDELAKYNVISVTLNVYQEPKLAHDIGVSSIPFIACLVDGRVQSYYQSSLSLSSIVKFLRNLLPTNLVPLLRTSAEQDKFIYSSPQMNRLSALIISNEKKLKLRYILLAYEYRDYYKFGHVSTEISEYSFLAKQYNLTINSAITHILIFDEGIKKPRQLLTVDSNYIDVETLKRQLNKWPFLKLPRISSQQRFDDLCMSAISKDNETSRPRLCIILFANETPSSSLARKRLIDFMEQNNLDHNERVVFTYLDPFKQSEFTRSLVLETEKTQPAFIKESIYHTIIVLERHPRNSRKAQYRWIGNKWEPKILDELDRAKLELFQIIKEYDRYSSSNFEKLVLSTIFDEEAPGLLERIFWRFIDYIGRISDLITSKESFLAVVVMIACACVTALFLYSSPIDFLTPDSPKSDPDSTYSNKNFRHYNNNGQEFVSQTMNNNSHEEMKLIELRAETYNGMIRLLKPGCRSIVLLTDNESKDVLFPQFKKAIWPYRRNKTLLFGYLCLDKNFDWYKSLLEEILGQESLKLNKKNCIGTVLSLNGFKRYVRVYHTKHHETSQYGCDDETNEDGAFLGFTNDEKNGYEIYENDVELGSSQSNSSATTVDRLLDRFPIWLDKVFDGLTKRYFVNHWPENIK